MEKVKSIFTTFFDINSFSVRKQQMVEKVLKTVLFTNHLKDYLY